MKISWRPFPWGMTSAILLSATMVKPSSPSSVRSMVSALFSIACKACAFLDRIEKKGQGLNLSLQVLDGILCHDGEMHLDRLVPDREKTFAQLQDQIELKQADSRVNLKPMTLEGCVVRLADTISYIGRDLEDAILLNLIHRDDLPRLAREQLGQTNGTIVYTLVSDLIENSYNKNYVCYSQEVAEALGILRQFIIRIFTIAAGLKLKPLKSRSFLRPCLSAS